MEKSRVYVGKIHPAFFKYSGIFKKFDKSENEKGEIALRSPFFVLRYDFETGTLLCEDSDVLFDFVKLIKDNYGTSVTRQELEDSIEWHTLGDNWSILNIGVCVLDDDISGWDGSPNSIFIDGNAPGKIVDIHSQFWNKKALYDAWKLNGDDIQKLGGKVTLPNLLDSLVIYKDDKVKHQKIEKLINSIL
jgi:hypothetical protein